MDKKLAHVVGFRCPVCKQLCTAFDEVLLTEDFYFVANWQHCGKSLTSGEVSALSLFPHREQERGN